MIDEINRLNREINQYQIAIDVLLHPKMNVSLSVSEAFLRAIHDKAGKETLTNFLLNNTVYFVNNRDENCEGYLRSIGFNDYKNECESM